MNEHASVHCDGERADGKGALQEHAFWHRLLLACMAVAFTVCSSLPSEAVNGEPVGGQGVHRTATCTSDFTVSCDDRSQAGVVSCHMRRQPNVDEGLAVNVCIDGRITTGTTQTLEVNVNQVRATDFGEYVCGRDSNGKNFCVVCDTFKDPEASGGASHCVKIVDNGGATGPSTCGAYNVSADTGGLCLNAEQDLEQFFSEPHLAFSIGIDGSDAAASAAGVGEEDGKDLLVCGARSWQCISDRSQSLATQAQQVQGQQTHALIDTPCCIRLASGSYYCSAKLTPSSTCR
jgi:hypothetical protein